jgi:glutamate-1-semialdehyde 2,1-aminomutase
VPCYETVRFSLSGSEAVHGAIRLARGITGRPLVVKFAGHYHGWLDEMYTGIAGGPPPVPESDGQGPGAIASVRLIDWNDGNELRRLFAQVGDQIAAVIMEPLPCNQGVIWPESGYLELARELTANAGSLLIFDEVITGFRIGLGGAQERYRVSPDLAVVAKAMGNGFPISAFGGSAELMEPVAKNAVVHAGTYNGGGISVAAAMATLDRLTADEPVYERMTALGERLMAGLVDAAISHGHQFTAQGPGPVFFGWFAEREVRSFRDHLDADAEKYARFAELMLDAGVRIIPAGRWYLSAVHDEDDVDRALDAADRAFAALT